MFTNECVKSKTEQGDYHYSGGTNKIGRFKYESKLTKLRLHDCQLGCLDQRLHDTELLLDVLKQQAAPSSKMSKQLNNTST